MAIMNALALVPRRRRHPLRTQAGGVHERAQPEPAPQHCAVVGPRTRRATRPMGVGSELTPSARWLESSGTKKTVQGDRGADAGARQEQSLAGSDRRGPLPHQHQRRPEHLQPHDRYGPPLYPAIRPISTAPSALFQPHLPRPSHPPPTPVSPRHQPPPVPHSSLVLTWPPARPAPPLLFT